MRLYSGCAYIPNISACAYRRTKNLCLVSTAIMLFHAKLRKLWLKSAQSTHFLWFTRTKIGQTIHVYTKYTCPTFILFSDKSACPCNLCISIIGEVITGNLLAHAPMIGKLSMAKRVLKQAVFVYKRMRLNTHKYGNWKRIIIERVITLFTFSVLAPWWPSQESDRTEIQCQGTYDLGGNVYKVLSP